MLVEFFKCFSLQLTRALAATIRRPRARLPLTTHGQNQSRPWAFRASRQRNHMFYIMFHRPAMRLRVKTIVPNPSGFRISTITAPLENKLYHAFALTPIGGGGEQREEHYKIRKKEKYMVFF